MSGKKSKTKGKTWEREVANHLSETYDDSFTRVPHSGAYVGGKNNFRKSTLAENQIQAHKGDIFPPLDWKRFNAECKNYATLPYHQLFQGDVKQLDEWITQTYDAADDGDVNIIFIKITRKGKWVMYESHNPFITERNVKYKDWVFCHWDEFWSNPANVALLKTLATTL